MKIARFLLIALVIGFAAVAARADVVDPRITIGGGGSCAAQSLTSETQSFPGLTTGCMIDFTNNISNDNEGETLFQIVVNITSAFEGPLSCVVGENSPFNNGFVSSPTSCTFDSIVPESFLSVFRTSGLGPGQTFSLTFDTNFGPTVDATLAQEVIAPEPGSALLLLTGAGALFALRKRRQATA
jgi:hypothetical protein